MTNNDDTNNASAIANDTRGKSVTADGITRYDNGTYTVTDRDGNVFNSFREMWDAIPGQIGPSDRRRAAK